MAEPSTWTVTLPWPEAVLSPNARAHWRAKAKATKRARDMTGWLLAEVGLPPLVPPVAVHMAFHPRDRRRRDLDNAFAAMKAHRDAIADVAGVDDSRFALSLAMGEPMKGGRVVVTVTGEAAR